MARLPISYLKSPQPDHLNINFVISDCPTPQNLGEYAQQLAMHSVVHLVRICSSEMYDAAALTASYATFAAAAEPSVLTVNDNIKFEDGQVPGDEIICRWLDVVQQTMQSQPGKAIGVHCVSGLGRAPVLVAIAVWTYCVKMEPLEIVEWLRLYRKGALNRKQLIWFEQEFIKRYRSEARHRRERLSKKPSEKCLVQ